MPINSKVKSLYDTMKAGGADVGTEQEFNDYFFASGAQGYKNRKAVYDTFKQNGADVGNSYEEFRDWLGLVPKNQANASAPQQKSTPSSTPWSYQAAMEKAKSALNPRPAQVPSPEDYLRRPEMDEQDIFSGNALKNTVNKQRDAIAQVPNKGMEQVKQDEVRRQQPIVKTETPADQYVIKNQGQWENELAKSVDNILDKKIADEVGASIAQADVEWQRTFNKYNTANVGSVYGAQATGAMKMANNAASSEKALQSLLGNATERFKEYFSQPETIEKIKQQADYFGINPDDYVNQVVLPQVKGRLEAAFDQSQIAKYTPKSHFEYLMGDLGGVLGTIIRGGMMTKKQRQYEQAGAQRFADERGGGVLGAVEDAARMGIGMATDPLMYATGGAAGAATKAVAGTKLGGKILGDAGIKAASRFANGNAVQRMFMQAPQMMFSQGLNLGTYMGTGNVINNYSVGDDTSFGNNAKLFMEGFRDGGVMGGVLGLLGSMTRGLGANIGIKAGDTGWQKALHGTEKGLYNIGALGVEGLGFHTAEELNKYLRGDDMDFSVKGTLDGAITAGVLKLTSGHNLSDVGKGIAQRDFGSRFGGKLIQFLSPDINTGLKITDADRKALSFLGDVDNVMKNIKTKDDAAGLYKQVMENPEVPFDTKQKFSAFTVGEVSNSKPIWQRLDWNDGDSVLKTRDKNGNVVDRFEFKDADERNQKIQELTDERNNQLMLNNLGKHYSKMALEMPELKAKILEKMGYNPDAGENDKINRDIMDSIAGGGVNEKIFIEALTELGQEMQTKGEKMEDAFVKTFAQEYGMSEEDLLKVAHKDYRDRTPEEQEMMRDFGKRLNDELNPPDQIHPEQSIDNGRAKADNTAPDEVLNPETNREVTQTLLEARQAYEQLLDTHGLSHEEMDKMDYPDRAQYIYDNFGDEEGAKTIIRLWNAELEHQGYFDRIREKTEEAADLMLNEMQLKGTIDGEPTQDIITIRDAQGNEYTLVSGDVSFNDGVMSPDSPSGMIIVRDATGQAISMKPSMDLSLVSAEPRDVKRAQLLENIQVDASNNYLMNGGSELDQLSQMVQQKLSVKPKEEVKPPLAAEQSGNLDNAGGEAGAEIGTGANNPPATAPSIPLAKNGRTKLYHQVEPDVAINDILQQPESKFVKGNNDPSVVADRRIKSANERGSKLDKKLQKRYQEQDFTEEEAEDITTWEQTGEKPKTEMGKFVAEMSEIKEELDYYENLKQVWEKRKPRKPVIPDNPITDEDFANVPEWVYDTPEAARQRGYKKIEGHKVERQPEKPMPQGKEIEVQYSTKDSAKGRMTVSELDEVQGSHTMNGQKNELHFIPEAQPKAEFGADRQQKASTNATEEKFRPDLMLTFNDTQSAYQSSATQTNRRGEVIQGNGRRNLAEYIYAPGNEAVAERYRQYLMEHAEELGTTAEEIAKMEKPFAHIVLDVNDTEAIRLGQFKASDLESGGKEIPEVSTVTTKLGDKYSNFTNIVLRHDDPDASLAERIEGNAEEAVTWLNKAGVISDTEAKTLLSDKAAARQFVRDMLTDTLFRGASDNVRSSFYELPKNIQSAIVSVVGREVSTGAEATILKEVQASIQAFHELSAASEQFAGVKGRSYEERKRQADTAIEDWLRQINIDGSLNTGKYSNFALELAKRYKSHTDQKSLAGLLRDYYDLVNGSTREVSMFDAEPSQGKLTRDEAIKKVFGIDYKPIENKENGRQRTVSVAGNDQESQTGGRGEPSRPESGEQKEGRTGPSDSRGGDSVDDREVKPKKTTIDTSDPIEGINQAAQSFNEERRDQLFRDADNFEEGARIPVVYKEALSGQREKYSSELLPDEYDTPHAMLDAARNAYEGYYIELSPDGKELIIHTWDSVLGNKKNGKPMTKKELARREAYLERKTRNALNAAKEISRKLNLDLEVRTDTDGMTERQASAKGWYDPETGKITINLSAHRSQQDLIRTILHEGVAHHGLRQLVGEENFNNLLDRIYEYADDAIRKSIDDIASKKNVPHRVAVEEYLAKLAENTDFKNATNSGWWNKIKAVFSKWLTDTFGFDVQLSDADLRYLLWRSYENLKDSKRTKSESGNATDTAKMVELNVEPLTPKPSEQTNKAAEAEVVGLKRLNDYGLNESTEAGRKMTKFKGQNPNTIALRYDKESGTYVVMGNDAAVVGRVFNGQHSVEDGMDVMRIPESQMGGYANIFDIITPKLVREGYKLAVLDYNGFIPPKQDRFMGGGQSVADGSPESLRDQIRTQENLLKRINSRIPEEEELYREWQEAIGTDKEQETRAAYEEYAKANKADIEQKQITNMDLDKLREQLADAEKYKDKGLLFRDDESEENIKDNQKEKEEADAMMTIEKAADEFRKEREEKLNNEYKDKKSEDLFLSLPKKEGEDYNGAINELTSRVLSGRTRLGREDSESSRKSHTAAQIGAEIISADRGGIPAAATIRADFNEDAPVRRGIEDAIESWSKSNGFWLDEESIRESSYGKKQIGGGEESRVYLSEDRKTVTKFNDPYHRNNGGLLKALRNIDVFNTLFGVAPYKVVGYTRDAEGKFRVVIEQPFVAGKQYEFEDYLRDRTNGKTPEEKVIDMFDEMDMHPVEGDTTTFANEKYYVRDIHHGNVVEDKDGNMIVIDANPKYNEQYKKNVYGEDGFVLEDVSNPEYRESQPSESQPVENRDKVAAHVNTLKATLGEKINVVDSVDGITNEKVKKDIEDGKKVMGWYDPKTGQVSLYMPNIPNSYEAEKTVWHETVGHKGMRELLGEEGYKKYMTKLWLDDKNTELGEYVNERMKQGDLDIYKHVNEWLGEQAEKEVKNPYENASMWQKVRQAMSDGLRIAGYKLSPSIMDVKYMTWLSEQNKKGKVSEAKKKAMLEKLMGERYDTNTYNNKVYRNPGESLDDVEYRVQAGGGNTPLSNLARQRYRDSLYTKQFAWEEAHYNYMAAWKRLQDAIANGQKIPDHMNALMQENELDSKVKAAGEAYVRDICKPYQDAINECVAKINVDKPEEAYQDLEDYMYMKTGLQVNRQVYVRDWLRDQKKKGNDVSAKEQEWYQLKADLKHDVDTGAKTLRDYYQEIDSWINANIKKKKRVTDAQGNIHVVDAPFNPDEHDASGLTAFNGAPDGKTYNDADILDRVMNMENQLGKPSVDNIWNQTRRVTDFALDTEYAGGNASKESIEAAKAQYDWYLPLRGFDEKTAEDMWSYLNNYDDGTSGKILMDRKGRTSKADTPIATAFYLGEQAIRRAARNQVKMAALRFAREFTDPTDPNSLITEADVWVHNVGTDQNPDWVVEYPNIRPDATPDEIAQEVANFKAQMQAYQQAGTAKKLRTVKTENIPYRFDNSKNVSENIIDVKVNGEDKLLIINDNPRAAQALNGILKPQATKGLAAVNRFLSQAYTSWSPTFVARNAIRDVEFASSMLSVKEGWGYTADFGKNYAMLTLPTAGGTKKPRIFDLFMKYRRGTLDVNNPVEKMFKEFVENGGVTGYVQENNIDKWHDEIMKGVKDIQKGGVIDWTKDKWKWFWDGVEKMGESVENAARFATYMTSRQGGNSHAARTIVRSVADAKEVSVNFNRKGAGWKTSTFKNAKGEVEWNTKLAAATGQYLRDTSLFYNATVQGIMNSYKNAQKNPVGFTLKFATPPAIVGALISVFNKWVHDTFDDDTVSDNPYADLAEYDRRGNLCIYLGHNNFVKLPLSLEHKAFYGIGDIAAGLLKYPELRSVDKPLAVDIIHQLSTYSPVDYTDAEIGMDGIEGRVLGVLTPAFLKPFAQAHNNMSWTGRPIQKENKFNGDKIPEYKKSYEGKTTELGVDVAEAWHRLWGGDEVRRAGQKENLAQNVLGEQVTEAIGEYSPAKLQYLIEQGFGETGKLLYGGASGVYKVGKDMYKGKPFKDALNMDEFNTRMIPVGKAFFAHSNEQQQFYRAKTKAYRYLEKMKDIGYAESQYKKQAKDDPMMELEKQAFEHERQYKQYQEYKAHYKKRLDDLYKQIKEEKDDKKKKSLKMEQNMEFQKFVNAMDEIE